MKYVLWFLLLLAVVGGAVWFYFGGIVVSQVTTAGPGAPPVVTSRKVPAWSASERVWTAGTDEVPVIMYHDVVPRKDVWFDLTTREFEEQMQAIKDAGGVVVPLSDVVEHLKNGKPLPPKAIALTFDDNTLGIYENAFPIMQRFGYHSTQFVHTGKVGVTTVKDHCTWDQLREMQDSGLVEIGSHTVDHPADLRALTPDEVRLQLTESKATIESEMGRTCRFFAYTEGNGDESTAQMVADAGYEAAWNEARAWDASPCDRLFLARFAPFRLDEILEAWRSPSNLAALRPVSLSLIDDGPPVSSPGPPMAFQTGAWADAVRVDGSRTTLLAPVAGPPGREESALPPLKCAHLLLVGDDYQPVPPEAQHSSLRAPLVLCTADRAVFTPYQPWMGAEREALDMLLPGARFAVLGSEWLIHDGSPVSPEPSRIRRASILAVDGRGRPLLAKSGRRATTAEVMEKLKVLGAKEAVLLGR